MIPGDFSLSGAMAVLDDAHRRRLAASARADAEAGLPREAHGLEFSGETYWDQVRNEMERIVWLDAYDKRVARIKRMAAKP